MSYLNELAFRGHIQFQGYSTLVKNERSQANQAFQPHQQPMPSGYPSYQQTLQNYQYQTTAEITQSVALAALPNNAIYQQNQRIPGMVKPELLQPNVEAGEHPATKPKLSGSPKKQSSAADPAKLSSSGDAASGNAAYKQWKAKYSAKDSNGFHCLVCQGKSFTADSSLRRHYNQAHQQV